MLPSRSGIVADAINTKILKKNHPDSRYSHPDSPHSHPDSPHSDPYSPHCHPIPRIPTLIPCILTLIPRISLIPNIPTPIPPISTLIHRIPILILRFQWTGFYLIGISVMKELIIGTQGTIVETISYCRSLVNIIFHLIH